MFLVSASLSPTESLQHSFRLTGGNSLRPRHEIGCERGRAAKITGVKATTVRKIAHELLELLERDLERQSVSDREVGSS